MGSRTTVITLSCLGSLIAIAGVRAAVAEMGRTDLLISLALSCGMALACIQDARGKGRPVPGAATLAVFFTWPVAVPIYLVWSRGWKRGMLAAMTFVLSAALLYLGSFFVAGHAVWGPAFLEIR